MPKRKQQSSYKVYGNRNGRLRENGYATYQEYLKSDHWAQLRQKVLDRDGGLCVACHKPASCVHHTKYSRRVLFGDEPTAALVSLCNGCHRFIEFDKHGNKLSNQGQILDKLRWRCRMNGNHLPGRCQKCMKGGPQKGSDYCGKCRKFLAGGKQPRLATSQDS